MGYASKRRYDIDILRVAVFGILILYHIGMVYVANWGYHVKSEYQSEFLANIMLLVNRWRLPLLFIISGFATSQMLNKYSFEQFIKTRTFYLLLPLLFGILVIVPPQLFIEMTQKGDFSGSFWQFMAEFYNPNSQAFEHYQPGILPHVDVNHLWYLRELWTFTIVLVLLTPLLNHPALLRFMQQSCFAVKGWGILFLPILPLILVNLVIVSDNAELARNLMYFVFFIYGYWLSQRTDVWHLIVEKRRVFLCVALLCYIAVLWIYHHPELMEPATIAGKINLELVAAMSRWSWILAILGLSKHTFDKLYRHKTFSSLKLTYLNEAVYPFYILHQTIIVVAAYNLATWQLGPVLEPLALIVITILGCWMGFEVIRRVALLRPLFGLKMVPRSDKRYFGEAKFFSKCLTAMSYVVLVSFAAIILF